MVDVRYYCFKITRLTMARLQPHRANISGRNAAFQDERAQYLWGAYTHIILQKYGLA